MDNYLILVLINIRNFLGLLLWGGLSIVIVPLSFMYIFKDYRYMKEETVKRTLLFTSIIVVIISALLILIPKEEYLSCLTTIP